MIMSTSGQKILVCINIIKNLIFDPIGRLFNKPFSSYNLNVTNICIAIFHSSKFRKSYDVLKIQGMVLRPIDIFPPNNNWC